MRVADEPGLTNVFIVQAGHCDRMGAPFNGRVCKMLPDLLDDTSALGRRLLAWPRDNRGGDLVALRCCAGLHALARANRVPALAAVYPPHDCDDEALRGALIDAVMLEDAFLTGYLDSAPQTNEIGRSAILLGGLLALAQRVNRPVALYEIGASAGLNMYFDRWSYECGHGGTWGAQGAPVRIASAWTGAMPSMETPFRVISRAACDLHPLDPADAACRERLLSYIWPDQTERLQRTMAAFDVAARGGVHVEKADARDWIARRLTSADAAAGTATVLFHSVFIQYLDPSARAALIAAIAARGKDATSAAPFAWLRMEGSAEDRARCELRLTLWPNGETLHLADVDWHGRGAHWH